MSECVPGTFAHHRRAHLQRERLKELRCGSDVGAGTAVEARKRFLQRRLIGEVDEQNALIAEIAKYNGPRDTASELQDMEDRVSRGFAATFDFRPREPMPKLLLAKMRNARGSRVRQMVNGSAGPADYFVRDHALSTTKSCRACTISSTARFDELSAVRNVGARAAMQDGQPEGRSRKNSSGKGKGKEKGSRVAKQYNHSSGRRARGRRVRGSRGAAGMSFGKEPRMGVAPPDVNRDVDFINPSNVFGDQVLSQNQNSAAYGFPPLPGTNFFEQDAKDEPGPGKYNATTDNKDLVATRHRAPRPFVSGKWHDKGERESCADAIADAVVGPGSYDLIEGVGVQQSESYRQNAQSATVAPQKVKSRLADIDR